MNEINVIFQVRSVGGMGYGARHAMGQEWAHGDI